MTQGTYLVIIATGLPALTLTTIADGWCVSTVWLLVVAARFAVAHRAVRFRVRVVRRPDEPR